MKDETNNRGVNNERGSGVEREKKTQRVKTRVADKKFKMDVNTDRKSLAYIFSVQQTCGQITE